MMSCPSPPETVICTPPPEAFGSGKFGTPSERMQCENASPEAIATECEADRLLPEPPHAAIETEQTMAASTVRVTINHGSLGDRSPLTVSPAPAARNYEQASNHSIDDMSLSVVVNPSVWAEGAQTENVSPCSV
jgi:hypothetical protein